MKSLLTGLFAASILMGPAAYAIMSATAAYAEDQKKAPPPKPKPNEGVKSGKSLEDNDRMGNFEVQDLMSKYNEAEKRKQQPSNPTNGAGGGSKPRQNSH
jgi:hypothetical protein